MGERAGQGGGEISDASVTASSKRRISVIDKREIHLSSLSSVFLSPLPSSHSPSLFYISVYKSLTLYLGRFETLVSQPDVIEKSWV